MQPVPGIASVRVLCATPTASRCVRHGRVLILAAACSLAFVSCHGVWSLLMRSFPNQQLWLLTATLLGYGPACIVHCTLFVYTGSGVLLHVCCWWHPQVGCVLLLGCDAVLFAAPASAVLWHPAKVLCACVCVVCWRSPSGAPMSSRDPTLGSAAVQVAEQMVAACVSVHGLLECCP